MMYSRASAFFHGRLIRLTCVVGLFAAPLGCSKEATTTTQSEKVEAAPREVEVVEVQSRVWPRTVRVQGNLLPNEQSTVGTEVAGRIDRVFVDLGTVVSAGQPLIALDTTELELQIRQAEAQLQQACAAVGITPDQSEQTLNREQSPPVRLERALLEEATASAARGAQLVQRKAMTAGEYETLVAQQKAAEARYQSALNRVSENIALIGVRRAELAMAKQKLRDAQIVAPYDGIVSARHVTPGEYLDVGDPVVTLVRADTLRFSAGVPERQAMSIKTGQEIRIRIEGEPEPLVARVSRVSPSVDPASRALWIEADVPNADLRLRTGLFGEAEIVSEPNARSLTVPTSAVREFAGIEKLWLIRDGKAVETPVRVGRRSKEFLEVLTGLDLGDLVVHRTSDGHAGPVVAVRAPAPPETPQASASNPSEAVLSE